MSNSKEPSKDQIKPLPDDQLDDAQGGAMRVKKAMEVSGFLHSGNDTINASIGNDTLVAAPSEDRFSSLTKKKR
ncbi:MAG: hypothetical protein AAGH74_01885 [Pseudomonadota bacterium]